jgi:WD40 repeat protein
MKAIAASTFGRYLACGGMDERIRVFNIAENKSMGELSMHSGAVTCLQFFEDSYLISGSEVRVVLYFNRPEISEVII